MIRRSGCPLWILAFFFGMTGVFAFMLPLLPITKGLTVNYPFLCGFGIVGYLSISAYSFFALNQDMNIKYEKLDDRDKLLDLLEDQFDLQRNAEYCTFRAKKNIEKIQKLFPKKVSNDAN